jgi:hypothetical protein
MNMKLFDMIFLETSKKMNSIKADDKKKKKRKTAINSIFDRIAIDNMSITVIRMTFLNFPSKKLSRLFIY